MYSPADVGEPMGSSQRQDRRDVRTERALRTGCLQRELWQVGWQTFRYSTESAAVKQRNAALVDGSDKALSGKRDGARKEVKSAITSLTRSHGLPMSIDARQLDFCTR